MTETNYHCWKNVLIKALFLSFFWILASSKKNNDEHLKHLIQSTKTDFDILVISQSRLINDKFQPTVNFLQQKQMMVVC